MAIAVDVLLRDSKTKQMAMHKEKQKATSLYKAADIHGAPLTMNDVANKKQPAVIVIV